MAVYLGLYATRGGTNLGIYNCRSVAGSATTSLHGEGRACDFGINPHGAAYGTQLADQLRLHSAELGIQCVIWNRRIWSGSYPDAGWRVYSGLNAHVDHIHLELTRAAAATLTPERVHNVLNPGDFLMALTDAEQRELLDGIRRMKPGMPLPARSPNCNPKQDDAFGSSLNAWAEAANARAAVEHLTAKLTTGPVAGPAALSDADVQRVAAAVVKLLGQKAAA